jgi:hypothetical protein
MITGIWTFLARTESRQPPFASMVAIRDDATTTPFVYRRLLVDGAYWASRAWPAGAAERAAEAIDGSPTAARAVRGYLGWPRGEEAFLLSGTALIAISTAVFICAARRITCFFYDCAAWVADVVSLALGVSLLGVACAGTWHLYPYDIPHAAVMSIGLWLALRGSFWVVPCMAVAAYSKETSALLVPAVLLVWPVPGKGRWVVATGMAGIWAVTTIAIRYQFDGQANLDFWKLWRNGAVTLYFGVAWSWVWPLVVIGVLRVWGYARGVDARLRRLAGLMALLIAPAVCKGWVEELRQYVELTIPLGLLVLGCLLGELGLDRLLSPRRELITGATAGGWASGARGVVPDGAV